MASMNDLLLRNRQKLPTTSRTVAASILLFCILTVQLSATEGQSPARLPATKQLPTSAVAAFRTTGRQATSLDHADRASNRKTRVAQDSLGFPVANQASHAFPTGAAGADTVPPPSPVAFPSNTHSGNAFFNHAAVYESRNPIPDWPVSQGAIYSQEPQFLGDGSYAESLAMPRSNYFGVGEDEACDEWSGFCNCKQKMFNRRGEPCSDKGCRAGFGGSGDCGCGH